MPNMSYCRFENTLNDLRDCLAALREDGLDCVRSEREADAREDLVRVAKKFVEAYEVLVAEEEMNGDSGFSNSGGRD